MTDAVVDLSRVALHFRRAAAVLIGSMGRTIIVRSIRRALRELPDDLLKDIGLTRSNMLVVINALAREHSDPAHAMDRPAAMCRSAAQGPADLRNAAGSSA